MRCSFVPVSSELKCVLKTSVQTRLRAQNREIKKGSKLRLSSYVERFDVNFKVKGSKLHTLPFF